MFDHGRSIFRVSCRARGRSDGLALNLGDAGKTCSLRTGARASSAFYFYTPVLRDNMKCTDRELITPIAHRRAEHCKTLFMWLMTMLRRCGR